MTDLPNAVLKYNKYFTYEIKMKDMKMKATADLPIHVPCVMSQTHCLRVVRHIGCDTTY